MKEEELYEEYEEYGDREIYSQFDELVENITSKAKKGFIDRLNKLEKENQELQEIKANYNGKLHQLEREYNDKKWELEKEYKEKERKLYHRPIDEIFPLVSKTYYYAETKDDYVPKCDKCNDDRMFVYVDPLNQVHEFPCSCNKKVFSGYETKEKQVKFIDEISIRNGKPFLWVTFNLRKFGESNDDCYISGTFFDKDKIISKDKLEDIMSKYKNQNELIDRYKPTEYYFENKEDCELFISFLNNNLNKIK